MMSRKETNYSYITGTIIDIKAMGHDHPTMITVQYIVNGNYYEVTESIKLKSKIIKFGFIPIGQKRVPVIENTTVGSIARVCYNLKNPKDAYIVDNMGRSNI